MVTLEPHEVCPFGSFCGYAIENIGESSPYCNGLNPDRDIYFVCELWAENYNKKELKDARDDKELP
jgi:hypothetical protein